MKSQTSRETTIDEWIAMVESLRIGSDWTGDEKPADMIQTHISAVLLGGQYALKLKKPVNLGFLDYTTLEKRRAACEAELTLNRRLCTDAYLRVLPIRVTADGTRTSGNGRIVDYAVLMKRLPADRMLDHLVAKGEVTEAMIDRVARVLADFHRNARRGPEVDRYGHPDSVRANWEENFVQTLPYIDRSIAASSFEAIKLRVRAWLHDSRGLLERRVAEGRICDGHGDLRCESICANDDLCIFDCIEFNDRFRCGDVSGEAAFLAVDLDARGRPDLGYYFTERYVDYSSDTEIFAVLPFYRCYRAYVRGKVMSFRLDAREFSEAEREAALVRARHYFSLAGRYVERLTRPAVIAVSGLSGTGKTSIARAVAGEFGLRVVSSDAVRKSIFGMNIGNPNYGGGAYDDAADRLTCARMNESARNLLTADGAVVLDATFSKESERAAVRELAKSAGADFRLIECRLARDLARSRLEQRAQLGEALSDATIEIYERQSNEFEPIPSRPDHMVLDTAADLAVAARYATDWLRQSMRKSI